VRDASRQDKADFCSQDSQFHSVDGNVTAAVLITSADIKDNTIRSADVRDGIIRSVDVKNESLTGVDVGNNSLTGVALNESTLALVPAAATAIDAQSAANAGLLDGKPASAYVADTDNAGGDATGTFSNVQIGADTVGRAELSSRAPNARPAGGR
jgi:hypothetical protein